MLPGMGYAGRVADRARARQLRAEAWTLQAIADEVGASRGQVSVWVRDVEFEPPARRGGARRRGPNALQRAKQAELDEAARWGREVVGRLSERDLLIAGTALYAGEGAKTGNSVRFANSDPRMIALFLRWFRHFFDVAEHKLRARLYLHAHLDLDVAEAFWAALTGIPVERFRSPYRAAVDASIRTNKHPMGCLTIIYDSAAVVRRVRATVEALLT